MNQPGFGIPGGARCNEQRTCNVMTFGEKISTMMGLSLTPFSFLSLIVRKVVRRSISPATFLKSSNWNQLSVVSYKVAFFIVVK